METIEKEYFGLKVRAIKIETGAHPYPWVFDIFDPQTSKTHAFRGMPNRCETPNQALKRGWYRAKWLREGTFENRYR